MAPVQAVADECCQHDGQQHCVLPFDLIGPFKELEQAAAGAAAAYGGAGIDVLVHNAGANLDMQVDTTSSILRWSLQSESSTYSCVLLCP